MNNNERMVRAFINLFDLQLQQLAYLKNLPFLLDQFSDDLGQGSTRDQEKKRIASVYEERAQELYGDLRRAYATLLSGLGDVDPDDLSSLNSDDLLK